MPLPTLTRSMPLLALLAAPCFAAAERSLPLAIEQALSDRQASLDSLTAQRQMLGDQVSYATLSISLFPPGIVADPAPDNFWEGLLTGLSALIAAGSAVLVGLGVLLPWLVVVAILAGLVFVIIRRIRRAPKGSDAA